MVEIIRKYDGYAEYGYNFDEINHIFLSAREKGLTGDIGEIPATASANPLSVRRYYYDKNIMTKVHGKRYAYKFDFQGLAAATQPAAADPAAYKYQSELFMSGYGHAKLNLMPPPAASVSVSVPGGLFQSASSYWSTSPGANLYAGHHTASGHVPPHLGTYPHYA